MKTAEDAKDAEVLLIAPRPRRYWLLPHESNIFVSDHVSGHEFTRAVAAPQGSGFSPWHLPAHDHYRG